MHIELVQDAQNSLIDQIVYRFGMIVEGGNRGKYHRAHARKLEHVFEVNIAERSLTDYQNELATLF